MNDRSDTTQGAARRAQQRPKKARSRKGAGKPKRRAKKTPPRFTAATADLHELYQLAVQDPPQDIAFVDRVYRNERGQLPKVLREDFCGTAFMCAEWVRGKPDRFAVGLDLHEPTLAWARRHNLAPLGQDAARVTLLRQNVLSPVAQRADVSVAFNFSYCVFKTRPQLLAYCRQARVGLADGGAFFLDMHGGSENTSELVERTRHKGFTYVWDQQPYDAIRGLGVRYIHFEFRDGTKAERAFTYDWRLWTMPEVVEVLEEAGFSRVDVFWEGATDRGEGDGIFRRRIWAEQEQSWIAYVVAWR